MKNEADLGRSCLGVFSHIINLSLTKLARSKWLDIGLVLFFACLWTSTSSRSTDLSETSHCNIKGLSVREVLRIENMITQVKFY